MTKSRQEALLEYRKLNPLPAAQIVTTPRFTTFQQTYRDDPVAFAYDCLDWPDGQKLALYQEEILMTHVKHHRLAVRGPHGLGKTAIASIAILHFALTRDGSDWKCPTTAPGFRQLIKYLWPEIHKWARRLKPDIIGRALFDPRTELMKEKLELRTGEAFALASNEPGRMEGAHADHMLFLFDEAKHIPVPMFDAIEGAFSTPGEIKVLAISTPNEPSGRFYDIHAKKSGYLDWMVRHVTLEEVIAAGRMTEAWAEARRIQWGEKSAIFQNRVLGEFANSEEDGIIPLSWIEAANERWHDLNQKFGPLTEVGVDVGRGGDDTVRAKKHGDAISECLHTSVKDTMVVGREVKETLAGTQAVGVIDVGGLGVGVYDRLREQKANVRAFNASESAHESDRSGELFFLNKRAAAWWKFRERLDPAYDSTVALPPDDLLTGDLTAPHWKINSGGKIQVESKDDIKKRIGRSTNDGDAVIMAFYDEQDKEINFY